jgi:uncharacterized membrane protein
VAYGVVLLAAAVAYFALQTAIIRKQGANSALASALGRDLKGKASPVIYAAGIASSFANRWIGVALYVVVALMWLIPDRRVERRMAAATP